MRFFLDNDVDHACRGILIDAGHGCWTASEAGRSAASDDEQSIYADNLDAVLITHDQEFTARRLKNVIGQHVRLACDQPDGPALLAARLVDIERTLQGHSEVTIVVHQHRLTLSTGWA